MCLIHKPRQALLAQFSKEYTGVFVMFYNTAISCFTTASYQAEKDSSSASGWLGARKKTDGYQKLYGMLLKMASSDINYTWFLVNWLKMQRVVWCLLCEMWAVYRWCFCCTYWQDRGTASQSVLSLVIWLQRRRDVFFFFIPSFDIYLVRFQYAG